MVNIRLNAGSTTLGRDGLEGVKVELTNRFGDDALKKALGQVSREQAAFRCSAAGVTVRNLRQNPSVGVQQATGDWEWLKEGDESLLVPGMRVTFFRSRVLREAASFVLVQHAGAYELTTDPAPTPAPFLLPFHPNSCSIPVRIPAAFLLCLCVCVCMPALLPFRWCCVVGLWLFCLIGPR